MVSRPGAPRVAYRIVASALAHGTACTPQCPDVICHRRTARSCMSVAYVVAAVSVTALAALVTPVRTQTTPPASAGPASKGAPSVSFTSPVRSRGPIAWKCAAGDAASSALRVTFYETEPALVLL